MRSNIARTCPSSSVPGLGPATLGGVGTGLRVAALALELAEERDEILLLLLRQLGVGRHRRRRVLQRAHDRRLRQHAAYVSQLRSRPVVAVLADLVAREAAGLGGHQLAGLVLGRDG